MYHQRGWPAGLISCAVFLGLIGLAFGTAQADETTLQKILRERKLNIGYVPLPPAVIKDPKTGALSGHFIESITFIANQMKVEPVFHETQFATFIAGLQAKQFDICILPAMKLISRATAVDFSKPLFYIGDRFSQRKGDKRFNSMEELNKKGVKIAVLQGGSSQDWARTTVPNATLVALPGPDLTGAFTQLSAGQVDLALGDAVTARKYEKAHPEVEPALGGRIINLTGASWTVRPGDQDLLNFINVAIDYIMTTGRVEAWERQYGAEWFHEKVVIE
jgi:polar amino acid transport system substrate-binding protein